MSSFPLHPKGTPGRRPVPTPGGERPGRVRFTGSEIALHWSFVAPYLVLGISGVLLLLEKNSDLRPLRRELLVASHEWAGAALAGLPLLVLVASRPDPFLRTLREALRWGWRDLVWLNLSALRLFLPRLRLPPSGRFNAGQKLNLLHVTFLVPVLAATGAALWAGQGAALILHVVHAGGALLSLGMALGHMYLALIHPPTRKALGSMFHGRVGRDYAAEHHPLWREEDEVPAPPAAPSPHRAGRRFSPLGPALVLAAAGAALAAFLLRGPLAAYFSEPRTAVLPAPLHSLHRGEAELIRCGGCHSDWNGVEDARCLRCHEEIGRRLAKAEGFHGTLSGPCASCHPDHRPQLISMTDREFNHDRALFRLEGAHRDLECAECHQDSRSPRRKYLGLPHDTCVDCHQDPHRGTFFSTCEHCHGTGSFREPAKTFDHFCDTDFPLVGLHRGVACQACHLQTASAEPGQPPVLRGTPRDCGGCHRDPHRRPGVRCGSCHPDASGWKAGGFDHARAARLALDERHRPLPCVDCHLPENGLEYRFGPPDDRQAEAAFSCEGCHRDVEDALAGRFPGGLSSPPSPHFGQVQCAECHRLDPAVETERCSGCHPRDYDGLSLEWQARLEQSLLSPGFAGDVSSWRRRGQHSWEEVVHLLRDGGETAGGR